MRIEYAFSMDVVDRIVNFSWPTLEAVAAPTASERRALLARLLSVSECCSRDYDRFYRAYVDSEIDLKLLVGLHKIGVTGGGFRVQEICVGKDDPVNGFLATALDVRPFLKAMIQRVNSVPSSPSRVIAFCYAFLILHPFNDGNGRMFRMICPILGGRQHAKAWFNFAERTKVEVSEFKFCMTQIALGDCMPMRNLLEGSVNNYHWKGV